MLRIAVLGCGRTRRMHADAGFMSVAEGLTVPMRELE